MAVRAGVMPLKLDSGADSREFDRARLLISSLRESWRGEQIFDLWVVVLDDEYETACALLDMYSGSRVHVRIVVESEFFSKGSPFFHMHSMYKQQLIKLVAPTHLALDGFITFDADVVCLRPFHETSFIFDGRLISTWERKAIHSWWRNGMAGLRLWTDLEAPGLGVTPNVLHSDLCADVMRYLRLRGLDAIECLCRLAGAPPPYRLAGEDIPLAWSEYSLYTMVGEWFSRLDDYHVPAAAIAATGVQLHSRRSIWSSAQARLLKRDDADPGYFLVVQSWVGLTVEEIVARCGFAFG
jgi:hypothetical protein